MKYRRKKNFGNTVLVLAGLTLLGVFGVSLVILSFAASYQGGAL